MIKKPNDEDVWKEFTKSIKKIDKEEKISIKKTKEITIKEHFETPDIEISKDDRDLVLGSFDNIDKNTAKRFRRGEFGVEAELDLHGYTEKKAYDAVFHFVKSSYSQGKRCIIIITGKGTRKDDDDIFTSKGILKERVPQWLNSEELRPYILSYIHPDKKLGGTGALYILLRRKRT